MAQRQIRPGPHANPEHLFRRHFTERVRTERLCGQELESLSAQARPRQELVRRVGRRGQQRGQPGLQRRQAHFGSLPGRQVPTQLRILSLPAITKVVLCNALVGTGAHLAQNLQLLSLAGQPPRWSSSSTKDANRAVRTLQIKRPAFQLHSEKTSFLSKSL